MLAADKASLDASLGIFTATSALLATKWATNSLVVVAKEADGAPILDATTEWEAHPLIKVGGWALPHALHQSGSTQHQRVQPKSIWSVFSPRNVVITAVKRYTGLLLHITALHTHNHSVLIPFGLLLDGWFEQVRSEEALAELEVCRRPSQKGAVIVTNVLCPQNRDIDWPPFPKHRVRPAMITAAYQFVKDMTVTAVRLLLQNVVWRDAPVWLANKTLKGMCAFAVYS